MAIIAVTDKSLGSPGPLLDMGTVVYSICLTALHYGLGSCIEDQGVFYPEVLRDLAGIPDTKRIMIAIAMGYPDPDFPANRLKSSRVPVDEITTWVGFE